LLSHPHCAIIGLRFDGLNVHKFTLSLQACELGTRNAEPEETRTHAPKLVEYVTYAGEGHGWSNVETVRDYLAKMEDFLLKYVIER
jgi:hypothetical protein